MALCEIVLAIQFVFIGSLIGLIFFFVISVSFISYLRELFNYTLIGGENAVGICKMQRPVCEEEITNRI